MLIIVAGLLAFRSRNQSTIQTPGRRVLSSILCRLIVGRYRSRRLFDLRRNAQAEQVDTAQVQNQRRHCAGLSDTSLVFLIRRRASLLVLCVPL